MARPASVQITRNSRGDGSVTFSLRVRVAGGDDTVQLGNTNDGWDEARAERARKQLLAKLELGLWVPGAVGPQSSPDAESTFAELAHERLSDRERNPAIRSSTTADDRWRLTRYLVPFFGHLRPSQITPITVREYRRHIHKENEYIAAARDAREPLLDSRTGQRLRTLSNESINKTLRTLAAILDEAEDFGWVTRNVARGRRTREPVERRRADALEVDEFLSLLEAAHQLDRKHRPDTIARVQEVRRLRDELRLPWKELAQLLGIGLSTARYLYASIDDEEPPTGPRQALITTLGFAGARVSEVCSLDRQDVDLATGKIRIRDAKTPAGVRVVDIRPRLLEELREYAATRNGTAMTDPFFPTRTGARRDRNNVLNRVVAPVVRRTNELRAERDQPPILMRVTPHTFRRTYITFMLAAGFDVPYVQDQVGHMNPNTTLAVYARVIRRQDRDALRAELRALFGDDPTPEPAPRLGPPDGRHNERNERRGMER
jgi:integrase